MLDPEFALVEAHEAILLIKFEIESISSWLSNSCFDCPNDRGIVAKQLVFLSLAHTKDWDGSSNKLLKFLFGEIVLRCAIKQLELSLLVELFLENVDVRC